MQSSLPTLYLQRFYLSSTVQTPRQALRHQESTLPSRTDRETEAEAGREGGLPGARPHSPARAGHNPAGTGLHLRAPETFGRPPIG